MAKRGDSAVGLREQVRSWSPSPRVGEGGLGPESYCPVLCPLSFPELLRRGWVGWGVSNGRGRGENGGCLFLWGMSCLWNYTGSWRGTTRWRLVAAFSLLLQAVVSSRTYLHKTACPVRSHSQVRFETAFGFLNLLWLSPCVRFSAEDSFTCTWRCHSPTFILIVETPHPVHPVCWSPECFGRSVPAPAEPRHGLGLTRLWAAEGPACVCVPSRDLSLWLPALRRETGCMFVRSMAEFWEHCVVVITLLRCTPRCKCVYAQFHSASTMMYCRM